MTTPAPSQLLWTALAALCLLACGRKDGPDCGKVSSHFIGLVRAELAKDGSSEQVKTASANLPTLQNAILEACEEKKWSRQSRECILSAKTAAETRENCDPEALGASPPEDEHGGS